MKNWMLAAALWAAASPGWGSPLTGLAHSIQEAGLDSGACFRVRDLHIVKEDIRIYLTDGYLIFGKPVNGVRLSAVFSADVEGGDAEILLFPPRRSERMSLASYTQTPNLNEHFNTAVMLFSDDTGEHLLREITGSETVRRSPERGAVLQAKWESVIRNLTTSFEIRLVGDMSSPRRQQHGFFFAALQGRRLGNFDLVYDPYAAEQITIGQIAFRDHQQFFDVWTRFEAKSYRDGKRVPEGSHMRLEDFEIEARLLDDLSMKAITRAKLHVAEGGDSAVILDISRQMRITEAKIDGAPVEVFQRESMRANLIRGGGNDFFLISPAERLESGRTYALEIHHEGSVVTDAGNQVYYVGERGTWYPNRGMEFSHYDVTFHYPRTLDLVAAGEVVEDRTDGNWRVTRRRTIAPMRLLGFNLGAYECTQVNRAGSTVQVCANKQLEQALQPRASQMIMVAPRPPGGPRRSGPPTDILTVPPPPVPGAAAQLRELANKVADAYEYMSGHFGAPPWKQLTVSPIPGTFGQGFPGLVYLSTLAYFRPVDPPLASRSPFQKLFFSEMLHAHETAHQWWGNTVTVQSYRDEWLMEALAEYSGLLFLEKRKGREALDFVLSEYRQRLLEKGPDGRTVESFGPIIWGSRLRSSLQPAAWRIITYEKGAWVMHMLRRRLGDDNFLKMLSALRKQHEFRPVSTDQFRELAAGFLPPDYSDPQLESLFGQFVYDTGIPELQMTHKMVRQGARWRVSGQVTQSGVGDDFTVLAPIEVHFAKGGPQTVWVRTTTDEPAVWQVTVAQQPVRVLLDPGRSVLSTRR